MRRITRGRALRAVAIAWLLFLLLVSIWFVTEGADLKILAFLVIACGLLPILVIWGAMRLIAALSRRVLIASAVAAGFAVLGVWFWISNPSDSRRVDTNTTIERTVYYTARKPPADEVLTDDKLEDKKPVFDAALVDRRALGEDGAWQLNASAAVLRMDVPLVKPDQEPKFVELHPSYAAAAKQAGRHARLLPSVNLLDGKAKQFDDGLYAAVDLAFYKGVRGRLESQVRLIRRFAELAGPKSAAAPFLAAGLELAGVKVEVKDVAEKDRLRDAFLANETRSKPIGFYTWSEPLRTLFRFTRFYQKEFDASDAKELAVVQALAGPLNRDQGLLADYRRMLAFYAKLNNPAGSLSLADLPKGGAPGPDSVVRLVREKKIAHASVAVLPPSTSKEAVLFEALFPLGIPPDADLMKELVRKIRSGEVDLKPRADSGWYEYQVYALETLLLPEKGAEKDKLLLSKEYKKRMLDAFKALMTKRRETHLGGMEAAKAAAPLPPPPGGQAPSVEPRLRVEPAPTFYLRTARAYAFLQTFLQATVGKEALRTLHGLKQEGERTQDLQTEVTWMRDLFYGLYLISAEDIGLKDSLAGDEGVDRESVYRLASEWLAVAYDDADLATDTRVAVPVYMDADRNVTRLWLTLGVRLTRLHTRYVRPPSIRLAKGGEWKPVERDKLLGAEYLIPVDEFAEVELKGLRVLSREELRAICDREKTKESILQALRK